MNRKKDARIKEIDTVKSSGKFSFLQKTDTFFIKYETYTLLGLVFLSVVYSLLLFDVKVSLSGDDSGYIFAAKQFLDGKQFPSEHGAFYPIFLSFFMFLFGSKLLLFKLLSLLLVTGHIIVLFIALKKVISPTVIFLTLLTCAINASLLFHASQTFSEPLFLFIQSCVILLFFKVDDEIHTGKKQWKLWLLFGFSMFLLVITRNIGMGIILTAILYFCLDKRFLHAVYSVITFLIFYVPFLIYKQLFWKESGVGFESQLNGGLHVDAYNKSQGIETFGGIIKRFCINSDLYLSKNLFIVLGFKDEFSSETHTFLTILLYGFFIACLFLLHKRSRKILFILLYIGLSLATTFIVLQVSWDQTRFILVYTPLIMLVFWYVLYELTKSERGKLFQPIIFTALLLYLLFTAYNTTNKIAEHKDILVQNLKGNSLCGYTPDWIHYIGVCKWTALHIDKNKAVGARKPEIAFIYTNRNFVGIYQAFNTNIDTIIGHCETNKNRHYIIIQMNDYINDNALDSLATYRMNIDAIVIHQKGNLQFIFACTDKQNLVFTTMLNNNKIRYSTNPEITYKTGDNDLGFYPDSVLNFIKKDKLEYIVDASLRSILHEKTEKTIGTIKKMITFISFKYPNVFEKIHQEGQDNDEPAALYKLHCPDN